jgi:hypothetical protein
VIYHNRDSSFPSLELQSKESVDRVAWGETAGDLAKPAIYCHLPPFSSAKPLLPFQPFHSFLAPRGYAGQPGPRAENRERGREEPRCQAATECHLSHDRRIRQQSENAARRRDRGGYGRREVGIEQRGAGTDRLPLGRRAPLVRSDPSRSAVAPLTRRSAGWPSVPHGPSMGSSSSARPPLPNRSGCRRFEL